MDTFIQYVMSLKLPASSLNPSSLQIFPTYEAQWHKIFCTCWERAFGHLDTLNVFDLSFDCQPLDIIRDFAGEEEYTDPEDHWNSRRPCHPWYPEGHKISGLCQSRKIMRRKYYQEFMACFRHQTVAKSSHSWHRVSKMRGFGMILESSQRKTLQASKSRPVSPDLNSSSVDLLSRSQFLQASLRVYFTMAQLKDFSNRKE